MFAMQNLMHLFLLTIVLLASLGCSNFRIVNNDFENRSINDNISSDAKTLNSLSHYKASIDSAMNKRIGTSSSLMLKGSPEGKLGNFCADVIYTQAERWNSAQTGPSKPIDFAILNNGGLRVPIDSGEITIRNIYELMPFENEIVVVDISGKRMNELIRYIQSRTMGKGRKSGVPVSRHMRIRYTSSKTHFKCQIKSKPFDETKTYKIATSDYLAKGGDEMTFFESPIQLIETGIKLRDAFIDLIQENDQKGIRINGTLDQRIIYEPE